MFNPVTVAIDHCLFEPERFDEETDQAARVARTECGPNLWRWRHRSHGVVYQPANSTLTKASKAEFWRGLRYKPSLRVALPTRGSLHSIAHGTICYLDRQAIVAFDRKDGFDLALLDARTDRGGFPPDSGRRASRQREAVVAPKGSPSTLGFAVARSVETSMYRVSYDCTSHG